MLHKKVCLFGLFIDNLNMTEVVDKILLIVDYYHRNPSSQYVSTVNTDFLVNMLSWNPGKPRNPELFKIVHDSAIATPDGMPIVWLSKLLHTPLKERVTGIDLVLQLCHALGKKEKSIFLLGGDAKINEQAAKNLQNDCPGLKIAGIACPFIATKGENLIHSEEFDSLIIEEINNAAPDVLLINLGNPKQEIWFERVQQNLKVPVAIGIGGTLDKIGGHLKRAPTWMQKAGLEWLHRLFQEPKRLWKRYFVDLVKFSYMATPLIFVDLMNRLLIKPFFKGVEANSHGVSLLFLSPTQTITTLHLPADLNSNASIDLKSEIENLMEQDIIILDFQSVRHIDPIGVHFILFLWNRCLSQGKEVFALGIRAHIRWLLKVHRVWEILADRIAHSSEDILQRLNHYIEHPPLYESVQQYSDEKTVVLSFFGKLDCSRDYEKYFLQFIPLINQKNCIVDLQYCSLIENTGFSFLLKLRKYQMLQHKQLNIVGVNADLKKQYQLANVDHLFTFYPNIEDAIQKPQLTEVT